MAAETGGESGGQRRPWTRRQPADGCLAAVLSYSGAVTAIRAPRRARPRGQAWLNPWSARERIARRTAAATAHRCTALDLLDATEVLVERFVLDPVARRGLRLPACSGHAHRGSGAGAERCGQSPCSAALRFSPSPAASRAGGVLAAGETGEVLVLVPVVVAAVQHLPVHLPAAERQARDHAARTGGGLVQSVESGHPGQTLLVTGHCRAIERECLRTLL